MHLLSLTLYQIPPIDRTTISPGCEINLEDSNPPSCGHKTSLKLFKFKKFTSGALEEYVLQFNDASIIVKKNSNGDEHKR